MSEEEINDAVWRNIVWQERHEIEQILGRALGYPKFSDDPVNFPSDDDAYDPDDVCIGDHVAASLAEEAAATIKSLREKLAHYENN